MGTGQVNQLIAPVKGAILQYQRDVVFAGGQAGRFLFVVCDQKKTGQAAVYLWAGQAMGMGVVPVGPSISAGTCSPCQ